MSRIVLGLLALAALTGCGPDPGAQERAARTLVFETLSWPDQPVVVGPVVTQSNFAIVDWTWGSWSGGRTLLRREAKGWAMMLCGGAPLKRRPAIERAGVPDGTAGVLVTKLLREESRLAGDRRDQIERWRGLPPGVACPQPPPD